MPRAACRTHWAPSKQVVFTGVALGRCLPATPPGARSARGAGAAPPGVEPLARAPGQALASAAGVGQGHGLTPCLHPTQVPRRRVPAWSSWWTCGTPTSLPRSAKPSTLSSPRDDDGAARCRGFEGSQRAAVPARLRRGSSTARGRLPHWKLPPSTRPRGPPSRRLL